MYAEGFKRLGYATVLDRQIKKSNGQPMYFLILAPTTMPARRRLEVACSQGLCKWLAGGDAGSYPGDSVGLGQRWGLVVPNSGPPALGDGERRT